MSKKLLQFSIVIFIIIFNQQSFAFDFCSNLPPVQIIDYQSEQRGWFVPYAQFQIQYEMKGNPQNGLYRIKEQDKHIKLYKSCLENAKQNKYKVLIFPELALELDKDKRESLINDIATFSKNEDSIVIAGSYYDENRHNKIVIVMPNGIFYSYKIRESKFEASPLKNLGMTDGERLVLLRTKYGNILPIVCVDLISDDVQFIVRNLSNRGLVDVLANINYNPASWEFMREASALSYRHPLFVTITNISNPHNTQASSSPVNAGCSDDGSSYGNSSVFGSLSKELESIILKDVSDCFKDNNLEKIHPAYSSLLSQVNPEIQAVLSYEINLRLIRQPENTNAPDQGYPTIKNININKIK